jgi:hypothetical protein
MLEKRQPLQQMVLGKLNIYTCRRMKLDPDLLSCTNINSKWIKDLNGKTRNFETTRRKHKGNPWNLIAQEIIVRSNK